MVLTGSEQRALGNLLKSLQVSNKMETYRIKYISALQAKPSESGY
jgi:hypothetical protein